MAAPRRERSSWRRGLALILRRAWTGAPDRHASPSAWSRSRAGRSWTTGSTGWPTPASARRGSTPTRTPTRSGPTSTRSTRVGPAPPRRVVRARAARLGRDDRRQRRPGRRRRRGHHRLRRQLQRRRPAAGCSRSTARTATRSRCSCSAPRTRAPAGSPSWTTRGGSSRSSRSRRSRRATWPTAASTSSTADAYREIAAMKAFDLGFEVLPRFVGRMRGWPWDGYHLDVGTHEALEKARRDAPRLLAAAGSPGAAGTRPAVFLDRDGTMIEHVHYLSDPAEVRLLPGRGDGPPAAPGGRVRPGRGDQPVGDRPGDDHRRAARPGPRRDEPPARRRGGRRWTRSTTAPRPRPATTGPRSTHGDRKPGPGMLLRAVGRPGPRPRRVVDGRRHDQRRPGRDQRRLPGEHPRPDRQGASPRPRPGAEAYRRSADLSAAADLILGRRRRSDVADDPDLREAEIR